MIKTQKEASWDMSEEKAIEQCADSRMGKYYGPYFWIITDSKIPGKKHMLATEVTSEAVDCNECEYKDRCKYGKELTGPMVTIEEMIAKRTGKSAKVLKKELSFFHQVKNTEAMEIERICKSFNRNCSSCPLAIHKPEQYAPNNHLCITGMSLYGFLSEVNHFSASVNFGE